MQWMYIAGSCLGLVAGCRAHGGNDTSHAQLGRGACGKLCTAIQANPPRAQSADKMETEGESKKPSKRRDTR